MRAPTLHRLLLLCLIAGLAFSVYAAFEVLNPGLQKTCSVSSYVSCGAVDRSAHTTVYGIPDWSIGIGGYALMIGVDLALLITYEAKYLYAMLGLATLGLGVSGGLAYVELAIIHAVCPICLGAYLCDAAALATAVAIWRMRRAGEAEAFENPSKTGATSAADPK